MAALIWCFVAAVWLTINAKKNGTSYNLMNVVRTFFCKPILTVVIASIVWVCICVLILWQLGAWSVENLKTTIIWFIGSAFLGLMKSTNSQGESESDYLKKYFQGLLGLSVIVVFLAESYTLPIYFELALFPVIFFFSAIGVIAKSRPEHQAVGRAGEWVVGAIALIFIIYSIANIFGAPTDFFSWKKLSDLFLPVIFSIAFFPFVMFLRVGMAYKNLFKRMSFWMKDKALLRYAKRRAAITFGIDIDALGLWCDSLAYQKRDIATRKDIDQTLSAAIKNKVHERLRLSVAVEKGWNPYDAKDFLKQERLVCRHYKAIYDGWGGESNLIKTGDGQLSTISYYVTGDESAVQSLRLKLFMWKGEDIQQAEKMFARLCILLASRAVPHIPEEHLIRFSTLQEMDLVFEHWRFKMHQEAFDDQSVADYQRTFEIEIF
tara:strand:+ start:1667 stop:2968 length:1302 start_codon:yes stop_codon:yes gene_type:complete